MASPSPRDREEAAETQTRQLQELLQELRVAQMGIQILFAFLLSGPFAARFGETTPFQRSVYCATLLTAAVASAMLIAPTAFHRMLFGRRERTYIIDSANRFVLIGLVFVALSMFGAILLITDFLYGAVVTAIVGAATLAVFGALWYALPLSRRLRDRPAPP